MTTPSQDPTTVDVLVLGTGSGGEYVASGAAKAGHSVATVEANLLGGECPFLACIPSKVMLDGARRARAEGGDLAQAWREAVAAREEAVQHRDDSEQARSMASDGVRVVRGRGRVSGPHEVTVETPDGPQVLTWRTALVVGTGSTAVVPDLPGLSDVPTWTSDEALSSDELPRRLLVLGGGPVGCELAQVYASFGCEVTLVETSPQLLSSEDDLIGEALAAHLSRDGVDVRTGTRLVGAENGDDGVVAHLEPTDGEPYDVTVDRVLVVTGRAPAGGGIGLDQLGVHVDDGAVQVDDRCRALREDGTAVPGVLAVGDVTVVAPYTHTANHQARVVLANLAGREARVRTAGIPRGVYTDPPVYAVGLTVAQAEAEGTEVLHADGDPGGTARAFVSGGGEDCALRLVCSPDGRLLGAAAIGPEADSWAGELALAVTAGLHVSLLSEHTRAFPTWAEAIQPAAEDLAARTSGGVS